MAGHEVYHQSSESTSLTFSGGQLKTRETDSSSGYGIRVLHEGRLGFAYCQKEDGVKESLEQARKLSRFSAKSSFSFAPKEAFTMPEISNREFSPQDYGLLHNLIKEAREAAESHGGRSRVIAELGSIRTKIENSAGFKGQYEKTDISLYTECMDADGFGHSYHVSNIKLPDARELGMKAAEMAKQMQGAKKPEAGSYIIVMELEALESLIETVIPSFSGDWKRRKISRLEQGKKMFSEKFTMYDDPLGPGSEARPFDDEGVASEKKYLVKKGEIDSFLYDRETAALASADEDGACSRASYANAPVIGGSNITIAPGDWKNLEELDRFIEVHSVHGSHTANPTTGDIGLEVSTAFMVEKGKRTPVKGFMITGNAFDMLKNIEAMEKKTRTLDYFTAPRIAFRNVRIVS